MFRFCCRRSSLFKKLFDYKDKNVKHGRKSWDLLCKTFFILRNATGRQKNWEWISNCTLILDTMLDTVLGIILDAMPKRINDVKNVKTKLISMLWLLLKRHEWLAISARYAKNGFYFLWANPMNTASITVTEKKVKFGDGRGL